MEAVQAGLQKVLRPVHEGEHEPGGVPSLGEAGCGGAGCCDSKIGAYVGGNGEAGNYQQAEGETE